MSVFLALALVDKWKIKRKVSRRHMWNAGKGKQIKAFDGRLQEAIVGYNEIKLADAHRFLPYRRALDSSDFIFRLWCTHSQLTRKTNTKGLMESKQRVNQTKETGTGRRRRLVAPSVEWFIRISPFSSRDLWRNLDNFTRFHMRGNIDRKNVFKKV